MARFGPQCTSFVCDPCFQNGSSGNPEHIYFDAIVRLVFARIFQPEYICGSLVMIPVLVADPLPHFFLKVDAQILFVLRIAGVRIVVNDDAAIIQLDKTGVRIARREKSYSVRHRFPLLGTIMADAL